LQSRLREQLVVFADICLSGYWAVDYLLRLRCPVRNSVRKLANHFCCNAELHLIWKNAVD